MENVDFRFLDLKTNRMDCHTTTESKMLVITAISLLTGNISVSKPFPLELAFKYILSSVGKKCSQKQYKLGNKYANFRYSSPRAGKHLTVPAESYSEACGSPLQARVLFKIPYMFVYNKLLFTSNTIS